MHPDHFTPVKADCLFVRGYVEAKLCYTASVFRLFAFCCPRSSSLVRDRTATFLVRLGSAALRLSAKARGLHVGQNTCILEDRGASTSCRFRSALVLQSDKCEGLHRNVKWPVQPGRKMVRPLKSEGRLYVGNLTRIGHRRCRSRTSLQQCTPPH
jgi:hypothetical protein